MIHHRSQYPHSRAASCRGRQRLSKVVAQVSIPSQSGSLLSGEAASSALWQEPVSIPSQSGSLLSECGRMPLSYLCAVSIPSQSGSLLSEPTFLSTWHLILPRFFPPFWAKSPLSGGRMASKMNFLHLNSVEISWCGILRSFLPFLRIRRAWALHGLF